MNPVRSQMLKAPIDTQTYRASNGMKRTFGIYQVGLKIMLWKGDMVLLLKTRHGKLDLPGGRIDGVECETPLPKILAREIREELGLGLKYRLGRLAFQYHKYFRPQHLSVFISVYEAVYQGGLITLSSEHSRFFWVNSKSFVLRQKDCSNKEEYHALREYFKRFKIRTNHA